MSLASSVLRKIKRRLPSPSRPLVSLPAVDVVREIANGRCVYEGYQRGWGLEFGSLRDQVEADPLFRKAYANSQKVAVRSIVSPDRIANLFLIIRFFMGNLQAQNIIEFGSFRGGSAVFMATLLKDLYPGATVYALDTYAGMPEVETALDIHRPGDFQNTDLAAIRAAAAEMGLDNIEFVEGLIQDTADGVYARTPSFGLAHIDLDIYSAIRYAQDTVWGRMAPGGYVVYDDATVSSCIGATQAVEELLTERRIHSEQIWPHFVFRAGMENAGGGHDA